MFRIVFLSACALALVISRPATGQLSLVLNESHNFVLVGNGENLSGLNFVSAGGGLRPIEPGDLTASAAPFTFLLANNENQITYGNLGSSVNIDGVVELGAGWNEFVGVSDLEFMYGVGPQQISVTLPDDFYIPCEQCPEPPAPPLQFSVNADRQVVVSARDHQISSITLSSDSGSLDFGSAGPFSNVMVNTPEQITFDAPEGMTLDGDVVLDVGWNDHLYDRDIEYEYTLFGGETVGPKSIRTRDYDFDLPTFPLLDFHINEDYQVVVRGEGQPVAELALISPRQKLIAADDPGPFGALSSSATRLAFTPLGPSLTLDGELVLGASWDPLGGNKDIRVSYELLGDLKDSGFSIPHNAYPDVPEHITLGIDPIIITLDEQNRFVLTGNGQKVNGIHFTSETGALTLSGNSTAPFPFVLSNTEETVTLGILESPAEILGSYVLDFGPKTAEDLANVDITVGYGTTPLLASPNFVCANCDIPAVTISDDRELVFRDFPEKITEFRFTSTEIGLESLVLPDGITLSRPSPTEVLLSSEQGFGPEQLDGLAISWGVVDDQRVFVSYTLASGVSFGPLPLSLPLSTPAVPEPGTAALLIWGALALTLRKRQRS